MPARRVGARMHPIGHGITLSTATYAQAESDAVVRFRPVARQVFGRETFVGLAP